MVSEYIPISVIVTLTLFCTREFLDLSKKMREKRRVLATLKLLLSEELKDNFLALNQLYSVLEKVDKALKLNEDNILVFKMIKTDRFGNDMVFIQLGDRGEYGILQMPYPRFSTKLYDSYMKDVAVLDVKLYENITELYKSLRYCEKIRCEVIEYLAREDNISNWAFDHRISVMFDSQDKYTNLMQDLHVQFTKKRMEIKFSEVVEIKA